MNRIDKLFRDKKNNILSVYFTAGYPELGSTTQILRAVAGSGADMVEIGIPFSDPMADGPVIQKSNQVALKNGMSLSLLFSQLRDMRKEIKVPVILMGYLNPVLQFGIERFCRQCSETGIDGLILPDLPPDIYENEYMSLFKSHGLNNVLLISPQSTPDRINYIDNLSSGFIYVVSSSSVTGGKNRFSDEQTKYFNRVNSMKLKNPCLIGFGISDHDSFSVACKYSNGGIIGSAFLNVLGKDPDLENNINQFFYEILQ
jgi:tryptophan synthase alpha chain